MPVKGTQQETATGTYSTGAQYNVTSGSTWTSSNAKVFTVSAGLAKGLAVGTATTTATANLPVPMQACNEQECEFAGMFQTVPGTVPQPPTITSVSPSPLIFGATGGILTINGYGFSVYSGTTLTINFDSSSITATGSVVAGSDTQIMGTYSVACDATLGASISFGGGGDGLTGQSGQFGINVALPTAPTPAIKLGGNTISGTQSVVVGQQIALSTSFSLPPCMSISSQQWSQVPGDAIAGYTNDGTVNGGPPDPTGGQVADLADVASNTSAYTFYWVYPDNSLNMTYSYTMSGGGGSVGSQVATATFNVAGPSGGTMTNAHATKLTINTLSSSGSTSPYLDYGNLSGTVASPTCTPCGITFTASGFSNTAGGAYLFVQLINSDNVGGSSTCNSPIGLDSGSYPYPSQSAGETSDSPLVRLDPTDTTITRSFNATMYVMWQSTTAGSIPVPLGYQTWAFAGSASCSASCSSASNWTAKTTGTPGPVGAFVASTAEQADSGYPTWDADATGCD